ncbi:MAG TPA: SDR family oxidoreductase [Thermomicrobiales bacterium]|nr:SDR family oxidoreductase [Thermomicrobiales bacterium]
MAGGRLGGKRAIITGGAMGIGAAAARLFVAEGATVGVLDVADVQGSSLVSELRSQGANASFHACDVADVDAVAEAVGRFAAESGGVDIVFANAGAGTIVVGGTVESIDPETWERALGVNTGGVYAVCRAAIPHLRRAGGGSIVITSSSSALIGNTGRPTHAYAASKGALLSLARAMAVSYGPDGIRVNALLPGFIETRLTADVSRDPERFQAAIDGIPLRRTGRPEEMAACALFLASDESSFVTGAMLVADGGQTIQ